MSYCKIVISIGKKVRFMVKKVSKRFTNLCFPYFVELVEICTCSLSGLPDYGCVNRCASSFFYPTKSGGGGKERVKYFLIQR